MSSQRFYSEKTPIRKLRLQKLAEHVKEVDEYYSQWFIIVSFGILAHSIKGKNYTERMDNIDSLCLPRNSVTEILVRNLPMIKKYYNFPLKDMIFSDFDLTLEEDAKKLFFLRGVIGAIGQKQDIFTHSKEGKCIDTHTFNSKVQILFEKLDRKCFVGKVKTFLSYVKEATQHDPHRSAIISAYKNKNGNIQINNALEILNISLDELKGVLPDFKRYYPNYLLGGVEKIVALEMNKENIPPVINSEAKGKWENSIQVQQHNNTSRNI